MSIDNHFYVPAGLRHDPENAPVRRHPYHSLQLDENKNVLPSTCPAAPPRDCERDWPHQVYLSHGICGRSMCLIDDQFYFEDPEDARWFFKKGYKHWLLQVGEDVEEQPDLLTLWIDHKEVETKTFTPAAAAQVHE